MTKFSINLRKYLQQVIRISFHELHLCKFSLKLGTVYANMAKTNSYETGIITRLLSSCICFP